MSDYVSGQKYPTNDHRQTTITDSLVLFVAGDLLPLSVVESKYFRNLMEKANSKYQVPSRKHLTSKLIHEKVSNLKESIISELKSVTNVCLTLDLWSNRQMRAFLGITGHYITEWQLKSVMLACSRFKGKHTAEKILQEYEETVSSFEIGHKVSNIVTDNAANMVKAFNFPLPGFESGSKPNETEAYVEKLCDETEVCDDDSSGNFETLPNHSSCFAHTLQLVVRDGLNECGSHLRQIITKASSIVNYIRKSVNASEFLEDQKRLQASNTTRWNSQFYMLNSILSVSEDKLNSLECSVKLTAYERKLLQELCTILQPFEEATLEVQKEHTVSASLAVPLTVALKNQMQSISSTYNSKMVTTLKSSLQKRMSKYEEDENFITAAILDPRFKMSWCFSENTRERHISNIRSKMNSVDSLSYADEVSPPRKIQKSSGSLFSFLPQASSNRQRHTSGSINELDLYLSEDEEGHKCDIMAYWQSNAKKFPTLSKMAVTYLALPASSAPVERLFSIAGKVFRADRCLLKDKNFEALMFLKCNTTL